MDRIAAIDNSTKMGMSELTDEEVVGTEAKQKMVYPIVKSMFIGGSLDGQILETIAVSTMQNTVGDIIEVYSRHSIQIDQQTAIGFYALQELSTVKAVTKVFDAYKKIT